MKKIGYQICIAFAKAVSHLPFCILYLISDFFYFVFYYLVRYRRKVTRQNLLNSFPEKSYQEIISIEKKFYHNFADLFIEICKTISMKEEKFNERCTFKNPEVVTNLYKQGKSVFAAASHSGNWEWYGQQLSLVSDHRNLCVYKRLQNPFFDEYAKNLRERFGKLKMVEMNGILRTLIRANDKPNMVFFVADQSPRGKEFDYWTTFLNQETAFFKGLGKIACQLDYAVVYIECIRTKRGYYDIYFKEIAMDSKDKTADDIIESYVRALENHIKEHPENWLWSHRRWKHKRIKQTVNE